MDLEWNREKTRGMGKKRKICVRSGLIVCSTRDTFRARRSR